MMKKTCFFLLAVAQLLLVACTPNNQPSLIITPSVLELNVGASKMLTVTGARQEVVWSSQDETVATVFNGMVVAEGIGRTTITAQSAGATATCIVAVLGTDGSSLRVSPIEASIDRGETVQLTVGNSYGLPLTWASSDESIVTVDQNGLCTAIASGNAWITATTNLGSVSSLISVKRHWGEYNLVWSDEFDGSELDNTVWDYNIGGNGWGNNELQYYTNRHENVRVEDGFLKIEARLEHYENREYTSGRILSKGKKFFKYGRIESRISFPGGKGTWPAFWMMGNQGGWPACGEIDIIEHVGSLPDRCSFAVHTPKKNGTKGNNWSSLIWLENLVDNFHVYGVEWCQEESNGRDEIRFMVDGQVYATIKEDVVDNNDYWPFNKDHFIIFNMAIGGLMGGNVDDSIFDKERIMYVDWVRVYQREDQ